MKDSRTQLPLRDEFYRTAKPLLEKEGSRKRGLVLLVIEVEGVDFVLRTFGPASRDELIGVVGSRIRDALGGDCVAFHITDSRFCALLNDTPYRQATASARTLVANMKRSIEVDGIPYRLEVHVGISHFPNHGESLNELVRAGAFASYQARKNDIDYATYDLEWDECERRRFRLMTDLERALDSRTAIGIAYQPLVDLQSGAWSGMEALCRWEHETHGLIPPGEFLPFVEHTPLMMPLTEVILAQGLNAMSSLGSAGPEGRLAINLSPSVFQQPDLIERLQELFRFSNITPQHVEFEITETGIMHHPNRAIHMLTALRDWGCRVAIDDFGTGHSSLAYLADLPIDTIKIDRHFIDRLDKPWGQAIVSAAAAIADRLGLSTVAEGIETEEQLRQCREMGVTRGQGFYIARPMFLDAFREWSQDR